MSVVSDQENDGHHGWRGQEFIRLMLLRLPSSYWDKHIDDLTPPPYVVTQHFPDMASSLPNLLLLTDRLRLHSSLTFLSRPEAGRGGCKNFGSDKRHRGFLTPCRRASFGFGLGLRLRGSGFGPGLGMCVWRPTAAGPGYISKLRSHGHADPHHLL
jgi:hypothetical protein